MNSWSRERSYGHTSLSLSCTAVSAVRSSPPRAIDQLARNDRLGHPFIAHVSVTLHLRRSHARHRTPADYLYLQAQLVARADRSAKLRPLDPRKHHDLVAAIFHFGQQQRPAGLRDGFYNQHARHDGQPRKVSHKKWFVDGDILDSNNALPALQIQHTIDQEKGIAVRQNLQNLVDIEPGLRRIRRRFRNRDALIHGCRKTLHLKTA